jgi:hypothetical protein
MSVGFRYWPETDVPNGPTDVRFLEVERKCPATTATSGFYPTETSGRAQPTLGQADPIVTSRSLG